MLKTILSISGKPGLYKLISQGKNMLIVESVNAEKKRFPAYGNEKIISLADIAMYTDDAEVPLYDVLESIKEKEKSAQASIDPKKATPEQLREYLAEVLPNFDRERVYVADIKKRYSASTSYIPKNGEQRQRYIKSTIIYNISRRYLLLQKITQIILIFS